MFNSLQHVEAFNLKCSNKPAQPYSPEYWTALRNQLTFLVEEVNECIAAVDARDRIETLDAQADMQVVLNGLIFLSQHDHDGAMKAVCENNDLKYWTSRSEAEQNAGQIEKAKGCSVHVQMSTVDGQNYYSVHRDSDNKIMKPVDMPHVDLSNFVYGADASIMVVHKPHCVICDGLLKNLMEHLNLRNVEVLEPFESEADKELCIENKLVTGDIVYYNGVEFKKTNYGTQNFDIKRVESWLKSVGAI